MWARSRRLLKHAGCITTVAVHTIATLTPLLLCSKSTRVCLYSFSALADPVRVSVYHTMAVGTHTWALSQSCTQQCTWARTRTHTYTHTITNAHLCTERHTQYTHAVRKENATARSKKRKAPRCTCTSAQEPRTALNAPTGSTCTGRLQRAVIPHGTQHRMERPPPKSTQTPVEMLRGAPNAAFTVVYAVVCMGTYSDSHMDTHSNIRTHTHAHAHKCHTCTHMRTHTHTHTHTQMYTQTTRTEEREDTRLMHRVSAVPVPVL